MVFHSACSRFISAAAASQSVDSASSSARSQSASFFGEVVGPGLLAVGQVFAAAREERVARRAEPLRRDRGRRRAATGPSCLPVRLQLLEPRRGLASSRSTSRALRLPRRCAVFFSRLAARSSRSLREVAPRSGADEIGRGAEAIPEPLRGLTRRFGDFLPLRVQLAQRARRGGQIRRLAGLVVGLERRDDGFGHRDELFLALGVGEPAPVVHLAQLAHARRDLFLQRAQLARRPRRSRARPAPCAARSKRGADVAHQPVAFAQRDRVGLGRRAWRARPDDGTVASASCWACSTAASAAASRAASRFSEALADRGEPRGQIVGRARRVGQNERSSRVPHG